MSLYDRFLLLDKAVFDPEEIAVVVSRKYGISVEMLTRPRSIKDAKLNKFVFARHSYVYTCSVYVKKERNETEFMHKVMETINRRRCLYYHSMRTAQDLRDTDPKFKAKVDEINNDLWKKLNEKIEKEDAKRNMETVPDRV